MPMWDPSYYGVDYTQPGNALLRPQGPMEWMAPPMPFVPPVPYQIPRPAPWAPPQAPVQQPDVPWLQQAQAPSAQPPQAAKNASTKLAISQLAGQLPAFGAAIGSLFD